MGTARELANKVKARQAQLTAEKRLRQPESWHNALQLEMFNCSSVLRGDRDGLALILREMSDRRHETPRYTVHFASNVFWKFS